MLMLLLLVGMAREVTPLSPRLCTACYGNSSVSGDCFRHTLHCSSGSKVFTVTSLWGAKSEPGTCSSRIPSCGSAERCCSVGQDDCSMKAADVRLAELVPICWHKEACSVRLDGDGTRMTCGQNPPSAPLYSVVQFLCVQNTNVLEFSTFGAATGGAVVIHYASTANQSIPAGQRQHSWACRVEATDCSERSVDVIGYHSGNQREPCGFLYTSLDVGLTLNCSRGAALISVSRKAPFLVFLNVVPDNDVASAWVLVRAPNGYDVRVLCGETDDRPFPNCTAQALSTPSGVKDGKSTTRPGGTRARQDGATIALAVVACLLFIAIVVVMVFCYSRRLRERRRRYETNVEYITDNPLSMATIGGWTGDGRTMEGTGLQEKGYNSLTTEM